MDLLYEGTVKNQFNYLSGHLSFLFDDIERNMGEKVISYKIND